jgi:hypothetical protein
MMEKLNLSSSFFGTRSIRALTELRAWVSMELAGGQLGCMEVTRRNALFLICIMLAASMKVQSQKTPPDLELTSELYDMGIVLTLCGNHLL